ncbi:MAG: hypothetical protein U0271_08315 [Polyangiaceae bacterium]
MSAKRRAQRSACSLAIAAALLAALFAPTSALAEPTDADRAAATQLFRTGRELMEKRDFAAACPMLEESQRLDPGGGTLLNVALCHEAIGRLATAWTEFAEALGIARRDGRDDRVELATTHMAALEPRLSRLTVVVRATAPGLVIKRDGTPLGRGAWGVALPVDPGVHVIEASAPGFATFELRVEVGADRDQREAVVPELISLPTTHHPASKKPTETSDDKDVPARPRRGARGSLRAAYAVAFTFGGGWLTAAAATGAIALARRQESDAECAPVCTSRAYELNEEAKPFADASTATFVLAGASAALGLALVITAETGGTLSAARVSASREGATLTWSTAF